MKIVEPATPEQKAKLCAEIIATLPQWFGMDSSNKQYIEDAKSFPAIAAEIDKKCVSLLVYREEMDETLNAKTLHIRWLGILPQHHRKGIGRNLLTHIEDMARTNNIDYITVETLSPVAEDADYLKTYKFYLSMGFNTYHHFEYNKENPMVKMSKTVK